MGFLARFWESDATECDFARSCFFGLPDSPRIQALVRGDERFYNAYRASNLRRIECVADAVARVLAPGARVLEVGCGFGQLSRALEIRNLNACGIDNNRKAVGLGRRILEEIGSRVTLQEGDALRLAAADSSFDGVVACDVIEHVARQHDLLAEIRRVLRPRGRVIVSTDNLRRVRLGVGVRRCLEIVKGRNPLAWRHAWAGMEGGHTALTTPRRLRSLVLDAGFSDVRIRFWGSRAFLLRSLIAPKFLVLASRD